MLIYHLIYPNPQYYDRIKYIPSKSFIYLDCTSLIQNTDNYSIVYHYNRKICNKTIPYNSNRSFNDPETQSVIKVQSRSRLISILLFSLMSLFPTYIAISCGKSSVKPLYEY